MTHLSLDYETASAVDLIGSGLHAYARDPSTRVLMAAYAIDDGPVQLWQPHEQSKAPADLRDAMRDPSVEKWAWNASFENAITEHVLGLRVPRWRDTMVNALYASLPGSLALAGAALGLPEELLKNPEGKRLIRRFSLPKADGTFNDWSTHPDDWELFCSYCKQDVVTEREIRTRLSKIVVPEAEWALWELDQEINRRGVPVDVEFVRQAIKIGAAEKARLVHILKRETGLPNPMTQAAFLEWARDNGYPFGDLKKATVERAIREGGLDPKLTELLSVRAQAAKTSMTKFDSIAAKTQNGRIYNMLQFYGAARTGRWGGRDPQPQNFSRPIKAVEEREAEVTAMVRNGEYDDILMEFGHAIPVVSSVVRSSFSAPEGKTFYIADLNAIENRVIGWLACCKPILDVFRNGLDPYLSFAVRMFGTPYEQLLHEYEKLKIKDKRTIVKPAVLGCFAADTEVLTKRGWVYIKDVTTDDCVFDGVCWVSHGGVIAQGTKTTIDIGGARCTPDHLILTEQGWKPALHVALDDSSMLRAHALASGLLCGSSATHAPELSPEKSGAASLLVKSSRGRPVAAEPTFDLLNAGPRNRFVIRTGNGPLIAHNCGYMLGGGDEKTNKNGDSIRTGLWGYAEAMGVQMTREQAHEAVKTFREAYPEVVNFWRDLRDAAMDCVANHTTVRVGHIVFNGTKGLMRVRLPNGRVLNYVRPRIEQVKRTFERTVVVGEDDKGRPVTEVRKETKMVPALSYEGVDQRTKKWGRQFTHPGKITENLVQAVARDVLCEGLVNAKAKGFDIILHVHDEIICEVPLDSHLKLEDLIECMACPISWAPGLPLAAAGEVSTFYKK